MALILNIETSALICSVSLAKNGVLMGFMEDRQANSHARVLTVLIDELMKANSISYKELDAIAVSAGPGSYTGLRIGTSVAKGLCYALDKPLIAIPTLLSLAVGIRQRTGTEATRFMPVLDARRMDIYMALFDELLSPIIPTSFATVDDQLKETIATHGTVFIGGNAADKCKEVFTGPDFQFVDGIDCNSRNMIILSEEKFRQSGFENTAYFEPAYLKEFTSGSKKQV